MAESKLPYQAPVVREYGSVADVTKGSTQFTPHLDGTFNTNNFADLRFS